MGCKREAEVGIFGISLHIHVWVCVQVQKNDRHTPLLFSQMEEDNSKVEWVNDSGYWFTNTHTHTPTDFGKTIFMFVNAHVSIWEWQRERPKHMEDRRLGLQYIWYTQTHKHSYTHTQTHSELSKIQMTLLFRTFQWMWGRVSLSPKQFVLFPTLSLSVSFS